MFEFIEFITLSRQINTCLVGKTVQGASLGNSPHKFVWYNRTQAVQPPGRVPKDNEQAICRTPLPALRPDRGKDPISGRRVLLLPQLPGMRPGTTYGPKNCSPFQ